ncbi:DEAD/DEAH box helicase [Falcatimonas sp. MSJ-15]|uniref:SNF2-related protein n=1 Tax=Falcatimonas sp. MSJ-15 TaxID=2841515 RepID=UPI001C114758|nr:DEAD/DEAH box helicase [Falcatimonas sp. MSJ-15]MBU5470123.1 DEAD/DEAH box helicase [Falcatimonas sp. MSJ-15]
MLKLYPHQIKALDKTAGLNRCAYYLDMGLGKTFVGAEKMIQLGNKINLVICQKSKIDDWVEHFRTVPNTDGFLIDDVFDLTDKKQFELFIKMTSMKVFPPRYMFVGVINYELAWRRKELLTLKDFTLMLDESSLIQNEKAKQSKFILKLTPENVILLSGTPVAGKYENMWSQCQLLGWNIKREIYDRQYINWTTIDVAGVPHKIVDKSDPYKNVDRLKRKLREHGAVFMKTEECFELPEQTFIKNYVSIPKEYKRFKQTGYVCVDDVELIADTSLTKRLYMRQLCSTYSREKLKAFEDLLESTNDRLIVFYNFTCELEELLAIVCEREIPHSIVNGIDKDLYSYGRYDNSVTFIQYQAGAMGLNLQKANKIIYYSLPERSDLFEQSKKRIHRIGQTQSCFYYVMLCRNSIEEDIYKALEEKRDYTDELFRKGFTN